MSGTKVFTLSLKIWRSLTKRGMDLHCKCTVGGNGPCNILLVPHDKVVSKPSKTGRKYYLFEHYTNMMINGNGEEITNGEIERFFK